MNCSDSASAVSFQDVTALVAAVGSVLASLLLFLQFYVDHHRSNTAGQPTPVGILTTTFSERFRPGETHGCSPEDTSPAGDENRGI